MFINILGSSRKGEKLVVKTFNVTGDCKPGKHYMVNIEERLREIRALVDAGNYFTINRARQYGKTTTLRALDRYLRDDYYVVLMDFQKFGNAEFESENIFAFSFASSFVRLLRRSASVLPESLEKALDELKKQVDCQNKFFALKALFEGISDVCAEADKPIVLLVDEVDSASNNQVFLDFLAQLRAYYIDRDEQPAFQSVILAGVHDIRNLKRKIRPEETHKINSPWNIAADFKVDMSLSKEGIAGMLEEYETDYHTGMDIDEIAGLVYDYTSGYPFLVSRLCKLMDEEVCQPGQSAAKKTAWTKDGFHEAVRLILEEKNTLFESLSEKLESYPELDAMLRTLLFTGKSIPYNLYEPAINIAAMFGFVKNQNGVLTVANRIFDTWMYNFYLSAAEMRGRDIYKASLQDKSQFIVDGHLNMRRILEKFTEHFTDLYGDSDEAFVEEEGRKYFLLYLRPIINGTGNYYIESQTRNLGRTDVIVDYCGEQFIIEMKIWRGMEYHDRGEKQLISYLDDYHKKTGYMISFNFNKRKRAGVREIVIDGKTLIEAVI